MNFPSASSVLRALSIPAVYPIAIADFSLVGILRMTSCILAFLLLLEASHWQSHLWSGQSCIWCASEQ